MIVPVADMPPSKGSMFGIRLLAGRLLLGGALLLSLGAAARAADEIHGDATVISGNEIQVGKRIVRLFGIVAPGLQDTCDINEAKMKCGPSATPYRPAIFFAGRTNCKTITRPINTIKTREAIFFMCMITNPRE